MQILWILIFKVEKDKVITEKLLDEDESGLEVEITHFYLRHTNAIKAFPLQPIMKQKLFSLYLLV